MWRSGSGKLAWLRPLDTPRPPVPAPVAPEELPDALLRRLRWAVARRLATRVGGDERSAFRGPGLELTEVREYRAGDDVRHIDWNLTARTGDPHVRESLAERALDVWLLLDLSASVEWGTARRRKRDLLADFVAAAGQILAPHGHRIGALCFAGAPGRVIPPAAGRRGLTRLLALLRGHPRTGPDGPTDLAAAVAHAAPLLRRRALVIVVSDFLVPDGWQRPLARLAARHEVVAVRLRDPREGALPDVGLVTLEDPESGRQLTIDTADRRLRERFATAATTQSGRILADLAGCGAATLELDTGGELAPPLVRFLAMRRRARGGRSASSGRVTPAPARPSDPVDHPGGAR